MFAYYVHVLYCTLCAVLYGTVLSTVDRTICAQRLMPGLVHDPVLARRRLIAPRPQYVHSAPLKSMASRREAFNPPSLYLLYLLPILCLCLCLYCQHQQTLCLCLCLDQVSTQTNLNVLCSQPTCQPTWTAVYSLHSALIP
jgi:hypothetical protein